MLCCLNLVLKGAYQLFEIKLFFNLKKCHVNLQAFLERKSRSTLINK